VVAGKGTCQIGPLMERVRSEAAAVPEAARRMLAMLADQIAQIDGQIDDLDRQMRQPMKADPIARRLAKVPSIGPVGAMAVIRHAQPGSKTASAWLRQLLERRPRKLAAVALANRMARAVWAMMARGERWRGMPASMPAATV